MLENVFYDILERNNASPGYKNKQFKKSKNWDSSKGVSPWFWSEIGHFSVFVLPGNLAQENVFYDILKGKNLFLGYKKRSWKSRKIEIFPKGLVHGFSPKMAIFPSFF